jgi:ABC-type multidrug transport system ATPase subunit
MGASGVGKTTMLKAIAGQAAGGKITGSVLINGIPMDTDTAPSAMSGRAVQIEQR